MFQVYEVFTHLAVSAQSSSQPYGCSIANELLMILRKQVSLRSSQFWYVFWLWICFLHFSVTPFISHFYFFFLASFLPEGFLTLQINNSDLMYKKMGLIGALKIVSYIADTSNASLPPFSQVMCLSYPHFLHLLFLSISSAWVIGAIQVLIHP